MKTRPALIALPCLILAGCATAPDVWVRPNTTQADYSQDIANCQLYAMNIPQQRTPQMPVYNGGSVTTYSGTGNTTYSGNTAQTEINGNAVTTPIPDNGAALGNAMSALGDSIGNAMRQRQALRLCMQAKGYYLSVGAPNNITQDSNPRVHAYDAVNRGDCKSARDIAFLSGDIGLAHDISGICPTDDARPQSAIDANQSIRAKPPNRHHTRHRRAH